MAEIGDAPDTLVRTIEELEGEVQLLILSRGRHSRGLAMVYTKLTEARLWAIQDGLTEGSHVVIDRRELQRRQTSEAPTDRHVQAPG